MANVKLFPLIRDTLTASGVPEVKTIFEPAKAERFEVTEEEGKAYAAEITHTLTALGAKGFAAKDLIVSASESNQVIWERDRRFTDKHVLTLPLMQSTYSNDSRNDFSGWQLCERLRVAAFVAGKIADGMKNPKLGSFSLNFVFDKWSDPRRSWAEVKSWEPIMDYWFRRLETIDASRVDLASSWNTAFGVSRSQYEPGKKEVRINALGGPVSHFLGSRIAHVQGYDELFSSWSGLLDREVYQQYWFDVRGGGQMNLGQFSIDELRPVTDVVTALKAMVEPLFPGQAGDRPSLQVMLADTFELTMNIQTGYQSIRVTLPTFNETRIREAQDGAAFAQAALADVERLRTAIGWIKETVGGKVTTLSVGHGHDTLCLDAERFQAVFDALTPVVQGATFNDNRRSLSIRLETPDRPPQAAPYGNISLPIPFISAAEIPGHVQAFFEKHSLT